MLPFNADNLQDEEAPPTVEDTNNLDETGEEVAPPLSDDAAEALDHLAERRDAEPDAAVPGAEHPG